MASQVDNFDADLFEILGESCEKPILLLGHPVSLQ
jgi:hypothetical protein